MRGTIFQQLSGPILTKWFVKGRDKRVDLSVKQFLIFSIFCMITLCHIEINKLKHMKPTQIYFQTHFVFIQSAIGLPASVII